MASVRSLSEQIQRLVLRELTRENLRPNLEWKEVKPYVIQAINEALAIMPAKKESLFGDAPAASIATYTVTTTGVSGQKKLILPAHPVRLPHDQGLWEITPNTHMATPYIPMPPSFWSLIGELPEAGLEGQVGYTREGLEVYFKGDPAETVKVKLIIVDPEALSDHEPLPISADMESVIIREAFKLFKASGGAPAEPTDKIPEVIPTQPDQPQK